jgi:uncharacterized membrane protein HdeD (DUF308 family)
MTMGTPRSLVFVLGVLVLLGGQLLLANTSGTNYALPSIVLAAGAILVIGGLVGRLVTRRRRGKGPAWQHVLKK